MRKATSKSVMIMLAVFLIVSILIILGEHTIGIFQEKMADETTKESSQNFHKKLLALTLDEC